MFVGKLNSAKGYDLYLEAIDAFIKKFSDWKSISVGMESRKRINITRN